MGTYNEGNTVFVDRLTSSSVNAVSLQFQGLGRRSHIFTQRAMSHHLKCQYVVLICGIFYSKFSTKCLLTDCQGFGCQNAGTKDKNLRQFGSIMKEKGRSIFRVTWELMVYVLTWKECFIFLFVPGDVETTLYGSCLLITTLGPWPAGLLGWASPPAGGPFFFLFFFQ